MSENNTTLWMQASSTAMSTQEAVITGILLSIIIIGTLVGNVLVVAAILTQRSLQVVQNKFIISLAVADIMVAVFVMPLAIVYRIDGYWKYGYLLCDLWRTCDVFCCTASILHLCLIAMDRYWAITNPLKYAKKRNNTRVLIMIAFIWATSFVISMPPLVGWNDHTRKADTPLFSRECKLTSQKGYIVYSAMGSFYIPLMVITVVYYKVYRVALFRIKSRRRKSYARTNYEAQKVSSSSLTTTSGENKTNSTSNGRNGSNNPKEPRVVAQSSVSIKVAAGGNAGKVSRDAAEAVARTSVMQNQRPKQKWVPKRENTIPDLVLQMQQEKQKICVRKERRAARTLGVIVGCFISCWLPFFLMYVILPYCPSCSINEYAEEFIVWTGYVNSLFNPVIYTIFNKDFRKAFKKILFDIIRGRHCKTRI